VLLIQMRDHMDWDYTAGKWESTLKTGYKMRGVNFLPVVLKRA
jgi:hypothetical protein